jgi:cytidylate kinase
VAIDGPAGAGKSTVSRQVAERLGYALLDTGALYRSIALAALRAEIKLSDGVALGKLASELAEQHAIQFGRSPGEPALTLLGEDVSQAIRTQKVGDAASQISGLAQVRSALLSLQRAFASSGGVVAEGRDMGTVVFPDAEAKFFLTASAAVRAERRYLELLERGEPASREQVHREVIERDERDSRRAVAPLHQAADARLIDASELTVDQVVGQIVDFVHSLQNPT